MEESITELLLSLNRYYVKIDNDSDIKLVHECLVENIIYPIDTSNNAIVLFYYGFYYIMDFIILWILLYYGFYYIMDFIILWILL
jgi:hypothetical protein